MDGVSNNPPRLPAANNVAPPPAAEAIHWPPTGPIKDVMELACTAAARQQLAKPAPGAPVAFPTKFFSVDPPAAAFQAGMTIDADGAPAAYGLDPADSLDDLPNAGRPCNWWGVVTDSGKADGTPVLNGDGRHLVSTTALEDQTQDPKAQARYVDSSRVPFIVLPPSVAASTGAKLGDMVMVYNQRNGRMSPAIYADVGPANHLGEGSIALAEALGINSDARKGGVDGGLVYVVFPGSGNRKPRNLADIAAIGNLLFAKGGGAARVQALFPRAVEN
ncbi:MAG: hypothetical protein JWM80_855 [Cyanobacteria bacterium RYN_339]|nr:hypothetical protein [Cyanobacteria bacterium RYN_339]